ncbi:hypothetical protein PHYSODRAFT_341108 [Phytophthora sojae]|uniref:Uncharacterized protein n=1 Tax=Phytophthora sojae (strain P6497) TaxID=1094619 RepID=G5AC67_PHYSP|nr:hypothetical protein PHYSODRAFT_341108 [Phytophthora sojae]EGZ06941.1 hypothetical protein PHYSODRAFT_341108 [Phytophthora sojae]|eukprot:XP_009537705.1 hypothetical protein PHYSODRAFT_341108 [Phytophthora sojae]
MSDITAIVDPSTLKTLHMLQQLKRERRRVSQQKYMKKKATADATLERYIPLLRDEVKRLEVQGDRLLRPKKTLWLAAVEYFRIFEHGLSGPDEPHAKDLGFLRAVVAPEVDLGACTGFEALMTNWRTST